MLPNKRGHSKEMKKLSFELFSSYSGNKAIDRFIANSYGCEINETLIKPRWNQTLGENERNLEQLSQLLFKIKNSLPSSIPVYFYL